MLFRNKVCFHKLYSKIFILFYRISQNEFFGNRDATLAEEKQLQFKSSNLLIKLKLSNIYLITDISIYPCLQNQG
jgi:hypothetical protein